MKRWLSLIAAAALLAGCATSPGPDRTPSADRPASTTATDPAGSSDSASAPDPAEPEDPAKPAPPAGAADPTGAENPAGSTDPAGPADPVDPTSPAAPADPDLAAGTEELLSGMLRVQAPALAELPAALQQQIADFSPWAAAEQVAVWRYGTQVIGEVAAAPALQQQLASVRPSAPVRVWTKLVSSWEDGGKYYFHVQMALREADGRIVPAGVDVIEVSALEGGVPIVTGYAHAGWTLAESHSPVAVWAGPGPDSYIPPQPVNLPAPVTTDDAGRHLLPVAALESLGPIERLEDGSVVLQLAQGGRSPVMATRTVGGVQYVAVADLIAAVDGQMVGSSEGRSAYTVEWRPDLGQLCLWRDDQHPNS